MKIGLFGGTFDPPHNGHTQLVHDVLEQDLFDEVWYVPVGIHQQLFAKNEMTQLDHRLALLQLIVVDRTRIERYEIDSQKPSHTHTTLQALQQLYPEHTFSFLMGSDQLSSLHLWNCDQDDQCFPVAADEFSYYVYPRVGFPIDDLPYDNLKIVTDVKPVELSSTLVRTKLQRGESIQNLVSPSVLAYIEEHSLYER